MRSIFDAVNVNRLNLKNRLVRSATWEELSDANGRPSAEQLAIYKQLSEGGVGLIVTGFTGVAAHDPSPAKMMRLCDDALIPAYRQLTDTVHQNDCRVMAQIAMGAYYKKDSLGRQKSYEMDGLDEQDFGCIISLFADAALRAEQAGFDGVQIHAAHHFFLSRCFSPIYNHRTDSYGGSPEKRAKILVEVLKAIRQKAPQLHIGIKINFHDYMDGGVEEYDALAACKELAANGIDSIEISANGTSRPGVKPMVNEAYFLDFVISLQKVVDVPIMLVGGHRSVENMNRILNETAITLLSLSRPLIREPNLPQRWESGDPRPAACISCNTCYQTRGKRCVFTK